MLILPQFISVENSLNGIDQETIFRGITVIGFLYSFSIRREQKWNFDQDQYGDWSKVQFKFTLPVQDLQNAAPVLIQIFILGPLIAILVIYIALKDDGPKSGDILLAMGLIWLGLFGLLLVFAEVFILYPVSESSARRMYVLPLGMIISFVMGKRAQSEGNYRQMRSPEVHT